MGEKQKSRGVAMPTDDQVRMAKLTLEHNSSDDISLQKLIKKVIETTRCTASQAEVALFDNDNDVERAVDYILDNNGKVDSWTEQKSRKTKKEEQEREEARRAQEAVRVRMTRGGARRGGREGPPSYKENNRENRDVRENRDNRENRDSFRENREPREQRESGGFSGRGGFRGGRGSGIRNGRGGGRPQQHNDGINHSTSSNEEADWKAGPLVFESSSSSSAAPAPAPPVGSSAGPMSFAAMAKKATIPPPPPAQPMVQRSPLKAPEPEPESVEQGIEPPVVDSPPPASPLPLSDTEPVISEAAVNETWTNDLKAELGIGRSDPPSIAHVSLQQRVEFVESTGAAALSDFSFGFAPEPEPVPVMAAPISVASQSIPPSVPAPSQHVSMNTYRTMPPVSAAPPVHPSPPHMEPREREPEPQKPSPPSSYAPTASSRAGLSYDTTPSVAYHPSINRNAPAPSQQHQGQQQSSVPPPSTMFPQMPPYGTYPYMGMYSPVASGLRPDGSADPYLSMAGYFGMNPVDLSTILPPSTLTSHSSQQMQPRTTEHSDLNKYGGLSGGRTESVAPPPGFPAANAFVQPSLSSLLLQQQHQQQYSPFNFMNMGMGNVSSGRSMYEDDRRGGVGKDVNRGGQPSHHAQNTPPPLTGHPHTHYAHHSSAPPPNAMFSVPKKNQYSTNNWNN